MNSYQPRSHSEFGFLSVLGLSVDHKLFSKGRSPANFVVCDTFSWLLFKQIGKTLIRIGYEQVATELLTISLREDKYLQQLYVFDQQLDTRRLTSVRD
ncbi:MAG: hypothetical protein V7L25_18285 [Nostoc sp.]|uniref:hypothetical protein n=1 Tax=Nostoc sp. TaxID=1180 RepID=UPI002FF38D00